LTPGRVAGVRSPSAAAARTVLATRALSSDVTDSDASSPEDADVFSPDELAGVLDIFGALSEPEFRRAVSEAAFRTGRDVDEDALAARVDDATATFHVVRVAPDAVPRVVPALDDGAAAYVPGPRAWPEEPDGAEDLPHILDVEPRTVARDALATRVRQQLRTSIEQAAAAGDADRLHDLLDVTYDVEAWADIDLGDTRGLVDGALANLD
jgi:hypothetical protein